MTETRDKASLLNGYGLEERSPSGYHIALRVGFAFPEFEANTLPRGWVLRYTRDGMMMHDPVTRWLYDNAGVIRWSDIGGEDPRGVLAAAAEHDLVHGAAVSIRDAFDTGLRSFGTFCRADRPFDDDELGGLLSDLSDLHEALMPPESLTEAELETLRLLKVGHLLKEIAHHLGVTESAVKLRLKNAKTKMAARTTTQAVLQATEFGWIR